jgi:methionyl-tRNA synthetase
MSRWRHRLRDHVERAWMSPWLRALAETMLERRLPDVPVSQPTDWGLALDGTAFEGQCVSAWIEMLPGYMAGTAAMASAERDSRAWSRAWLDPDVRIVQFFASHQAYFHLLVHPALLLAWRADGNLPDAFVAGEPPGADGAGAGYAASAAEVLGAVGPDVVRFALAAEPAAPLARDVERDTVTELLEGELVGHWQPWLSDLVRRVRERNGAHVDDARASSLNVAYLGQLDALSEVAFAAFDPRDFSPPRACRMMAALVREGERLAAVSSGRDPSGEWPSSAEIALWLEVLTAVRLAQVASPIMPTFAATLWRALGLRGRVARSEPGRLPPSTNPPGEVGAFFEPRAAMVTASPATARPGPERAGRGA